MRILPFMKPKKGVTLAGVDYNDSGGGGGGGAVSSVNGKTGAVVLDAEDVGAVDSDIIAPTEVTSTSSQAYTVGDYFINSNGDLCRCTVDIASGGTITVGTNCVIETVGEKLTELNSKYTDDVNYFNSSGTFVGLGKNYKGVIGQWGSDNPWLKIEMSRSSGEYIWRRGQSIFVNLYSNGKIYHLDACYSQCIVTSVDDADVSSHLKIDIGSTSYVNTSTVAIYFCNSFNDSGAEGSGDVYFEIVTSIRYGDANLIPYNVNVSYVATLPSTATNTFTHYKNIVAS